MSDSNGMYSLSESSDLESQGTMVFCDGCSLSKLYSSSNIACGDLFSGEFVQIPLHKQACLHFSPFALHPHLLLQQLISLLTLQPQPFSCILLKVLTFSMTLQNPRLLSSFVHFFPNRIYLNLDSLLYLYYIEPKHFLRSNNVSNEISRHH